MKARVEFVQPYELNREKAEGLVGRVVILDVAFDANNFEATTLPFINALGKRLVFWIDHHDHERHRDFTNDERFVLASRKVHPSVPEMITRELVQRAGRVDTIVAHGDFDGIMAAAKWILNGEEPYSGADEDAKAIDSQLEEPSELGQMINKALKVDPKDDELKQTILQFLVSRCEDKEAEKKIREKARQYDSILERTSLWAQRYIVFGNVATVDIRSERDRIDMTQLLVEGQKRARVAVVRWRTPEGKEFLTVAAPSDSEYNFIDLFHLSGGMATRVTLPGHRYWEAIAKLKGSNPSQILPPCYILYADVDRIKDYLFASTRMRYIVASSSLLSQICEEETKWLVQAYDGQLVFSAGGITQAIFQDGDKAVKAGRELRKLYAEQTGTASITVTIAPWEGNKTFIEAIEDAMREMSQRKAGMEGEPSKGEQPAGQVKKWRVDGTIPFFSGSPFFRLCEVTGREFAVAVVEEPDGSTLNCGIGIMKARDWLEVLKSQRHSLKGGSMEFNPQLGDRLEVDTHLRYCLAQKLEICPECLRFPEDFEELTVKAKPRGYMGFIEADGNRFGEMLKKLKEALKGKDSSHQLEAYRAFSQLVKETTKEALIKAIVESLTGDFKIDEHGRRIIPLRVLILGGDDVLLAVQAQNALDLAHKFCLYFQQTAQEKKEKSEILRDIPLPTFTMSAGVVIAHHNIPFLSLHRMASELLKSAKQRSWQEWKQNCEVGSVDFLIVTGSNIEDLKTVRHEIYTVRDNGAELRLTGRPCIVSTDQAMDELAKFLSAARKLVKSGIPRGQLKRIPAFLRMGKKEGQFAFANWFLRLKKEHQKVVREIISLLSGSTWEIPDLWFEDKRAGHRSVYFSPLLDVIELCDLFWE